MKILLSAAGFIILGVLIPSILSLTKLGNIGDGDPILSPLRTINRSIAILAITVSSIIIYLWRRNK